MVCEVAWLALTALAVPEPQPNLQVRAVYGGVPESLMAADGSLAEAGIDAVCLGSAGVNPPLVERLHAAGIKVFAEFNTLHVAGYLKDHPDAAPVGVNGLPEPPCEGWQGISPHHVGYRRERMAAFRKLLTEQPVDGVWLDYHHAHASWERAEPLLPDTGFEPYALAQFQADTGLALPDRPVPEVAALLLGEHRETWLSWRRGVLTDWVREFRAIRDEVRPEALLGSFHCPWTETDFGGALRDKLLIDLRAQAALLDVMSPMPYHARFGHVDDVGWIGRQVAWLGEHLGVAGVPGERLKIWPIVQLSDWGESVTAEQVPEVVAAGSRPPATGLLVFAWGALQKQPEKVAAMVTAYRALRAVGD